MDNFHLLYQYEEKRYKININQELFEINNKAVESTNQLEHLESITVEIDKSVWAYYTQKLPNSFNRKICERQAYCTNGHFI
ncbi:MAG: hypothetical protein O7C58_05895 [Rickettsia endosymbiont of Ixodes persulcatus]|nr:hypothetical protein [Rickettsia endosymbiont of Ixodes persulcatus]